MATAATSVLAGLRLLVVEDEYMIAEYIITLLEDFGCEVAGPAATIEEAFAAMADGGLDGALLDTNLNGVSSAPIAAALRGASVPFVVVTGYGARELADDVLNCAQRITKPFSTGELRATLISAFAR